MSSTELVPTPKLLWIWDKLTINVIVDNNIKYSSRGVIRSHSLDVVKDLSEDLLLFSSSKNFFTTTGVVTKLPFQLHDFMFSSTTKNLKDGNWKMPVISIEWVHTSVYDVHWATAANDIDTICNTATGDDVIICNWAATGDIYWYFLSTNHLLALYFQNPLEWKNKQTISYFSLSKPS